VSAALLIRMIKKTNEKEPKRVSGAGPPPAGSTEQPVAEVMESEGLPERTEQLLQLVEAKINSADHKTNVGDFIRLLQLRKEINEERPREVTVTWVEPSGEVDALA